MLRDLLRGCWATLRETLPDTVEEWGAFFAWLTWAFVLHWEVLTIVAWTVCTDRGGC
jgi:hypothetical protein